MLGNLANRLFGSANSRIIKKLGKTVDQINALEAEMEALGDAELAGRTAGVSPASRRRHSQG